MENEKDNLYSVISGITELDKNIINEAKKRVDSLAKPLGSLGKLEDIALKLAGITGKVKNKIKKKCIIIMAADNGVVEEGVASAPQSVTLAQTINFSRGITGVAALSKENNTDLMVVDIGVNTNKKILGAIDRKIRRGTSNIINGPAMSYDEAIRAINIGIEMAKKAYENGYDILGIGEMGIGNTTTSSSVLVSLTGCEIEEAVGKGAGITKEAFEKKKWVVSKAIKINSPNKNDIIDVLSNVGGFDIAGMTGVFLGAAYYKIPVVIDGFISAVAALSAIKLNPLVKEYLIASHYSKEIGYKIAMKEIGLEPMLNLDMRLGEGSGCPIAFSIVEFSCAMMNNMATFDEAVKNANFKIDKGEFAFLVGSSGSGKSTLIKLILKEEEPTSGNIIINGKDTTFLKQSRVPYLRRSMGVVFQDFRLLPDKTVYDNVAYAMYIVRATPRHIRRQVTMVLSLVGLSGKAKMYPNELSGGEQQRVALARALVNKPSMLIADEPTGNLDSKTTMEVLQLMQKIVREQNQTLVMVTHDNNLASYADRRIRIVDGKIVNIEVGQRRE